MKGEIRNGDTGHIQHFLTHINPDKVYTWEVKQKRKSRTTNQQRLYFMWIDKITKMVSEHTGYEKNEVHELFKEAFLDGKEVKIADLSFVSKSTTNLSVEEMSEYMDRIDRWCIQNLDLSLPIPQELQLRN